MNKRMLINVVEPEEARIAVVDGDLLEELICERKTDERYLNNIYKGRVVSVEPSIQAAFVDFGADTNGFLHVSDVMPSYGKKLGGGDVPTGPLLGSGRPRERRDIQSLLQKGQEVLVQVTKDQIGTKVPTLTTYVSLAGRYLVLMPGIAKRGVSKKIEDEEERDKLHRFLERINPPKGLGVIVRTSAADRSQGDLVRDLSYLLKLWKAISGKVKETESPAAIYEESDVVIKTIRDLFDRDIKEIHVDEKEAYDRAVAFVSQVMPRYAERLKLYSDPKPLFDRYHLEEQIEKIVDRKVPLRSGGSIIIEQTEALVAIDVNSGKYKEKTNLEETAYLTNLEAAREIVRQVRLRDLGGLIVCDFIDMTEEKHRGAVERELRSGLRNDRARTRVARISKFCIVEMTRQRVGESLKQVVYSACPHCNGSGLVKTVESMSLKVMREIRKKVAERDTKAVAVCVHPDVELTLRRRKLKVLKELEEQFKKPVTVKAEQGFGIEEYRFVKAQ